MTDQRSSAVTVEFRQHDLKTWPEFFADLLAGVKRFELRKNDRDFHVGDTLRLHEYDPATDTFSGRVLIRKVNYLLDHRPAAGCAATFGLQPGYVVMGISDPAQRQPQWQPIETAPKDGSFIWLSDGFFMRVGYWYVITSDPSQEHWADMLRAERGGLGDLQWEPVYWQPLPLPPGRPSVPSTDGSTPEASHG